MSNYKRTPTELGKGTERGTSIVEHILLIVLGGLIAFAAVYALGDEINSWSEWVVGKL